MRYNSATAVGQKPFENLSPQAQTYPRAKLPSLWHAAVEQDGGKLVAILEKFADPYKSRRKDEARLLTEILK